MSDIKDQLIGKVTGDIDIFKKIASKIPGFKGYIERQNRRDADKLLRDTVALRFRELEGRISDLQVEFVNQGELSHTNDLEKSALRLRQMKKWVEGQITSILKNSVQSLHTP